MQTSAGEIFPSPVHAGFNGAFQQIWPATRAALEALATGPSPQVTQIFVTGHSLGGAVGSLLAYAAQSYLDSQLGAASPAVSAVLFAPPNVGPPAFVDQFNKRVNARRIAMEYDIVPQVGAAAAATLVAAAWRCRPACAAAEHSARAGAAGCCRPVDAAVRWSAPRSDFLLASYVREPVVCTEPFSLCAGLLHALYACLSARAPARVCRKLSLEREWPCQQKAGWWFAGCRSSGRSLGSSSHMPPRARFSCSSGCGQTGRLGRQVARQEPYRCITSYSHFPPACQNHPVHHLPSAVWHPGHPH